MMLVDLIVIGLSIVSAALSVFLYRKNEKHVDAVEAQTIIVKNLLDKMNEQAGTFSEIVDGSLKIQREIGKRIETVESNADKFFQAQQEIKNLVADILAAKDITVDAISQILDKSAEQHKRYLEFVSDTTQILDDVADLEQHVRELEAMQQFNNIPVLSNLKNHLVAIMKISKRMLGEIKNIEYVEDEETSSVR